MQTKYEIDDKVRILSMNEMNSENEKHCSPRSAQHYYGNSICIVENVTKFGYNLSPIETIRNFKKNEKDGIRDIEFYCWQENSLVLNDEFKKYNINENFLNML